MLRRTASHTPKRPKQTIHNEAFPKSEMPKKAHKPPNVPACKNSHLPIIEVFPTARSPRKPNPTYIFLGNAPTFSQGIVVPRIQHFTSNCEPVFFVQAQRQMWWSCMEQHDKIATLYCLPQDTLRRPEMKVSTGQNIHGPSQPFRSPFRESQHMLSTETQKTTSTKL